MRFVLAETDFYELNIRIMHQVKCSWAAWPRILIQRCAQSAHAKPRPKIGHGVD
jgi:hypothetical protein